MAGLVQRLSALLQLPLLKLRRCWRIQMVPVGLVQKPPTAWGWTFKPATVSPHKFLEHSPHPIHQGERSR